MEAAGNYHSGDDYVVEFLGYRFSFSSGDFEERVTAAAVRLELVPTAELARAAVQAVTERRLDGARQRAEVPALPAPGKPPRWYAAVLPAYLAALLAVDTKVGLDVQIGLGVLTFAVLAATLRPLVPLA